MAVPPAGDTPEQSRPWFRALAELRDRVARAPGFELFRGLLSIGMSDDFEIAVEEGATHVRDRQRALRSQTAGAPMSAASPGTLADLAFQVAAADRGRRLVAGKRGNDWSWWTAEEWLAAIHHVAIALERRGVEKGDRIALLSANCPEWHLIDFACHFLGAALGADLHHAAGRPGGVHPRRQRQPLHLLSRSRAGGDGAGRAQAPRPADRGRPSHRRHRRLERPRVRDPAQRRRCGRGAAPHRRLSRPRLERRPGEPHLHQRHHRSAQGRDAHAAQPGLELPGLLRALPDRPRGHHVVVPAAFARVPTDRGLPVPLQGSHHPVPDLDRAGAARAARGEAHRAGVGAAALRARLPARRSTTCARSRRASRASSTGRSRSASAAAPPASSRCRCGTRSSTRPRRGWCSARSRIASAGACGSPSPAAPPCPRRWAASSPRWESISTKATGSPRPRRCSASTGRAPPDSARWASPFPASSS